MKRSDLDPRLNVAIDDVMAFATAYRARDYDQAARIMADAYMNPLKMSAFTSVLVELLSSFFEIGCTLTGLPVDEAWSTFALSLKVDE